MLQNRLLSTMLSPIILGLIKRKKNFQNGNYNYVLFIANYQTTKRAKNTVEFAVQRFENNLSVEN